MLRLDLRVLFVVTLVAAIWLALYRLPVSGGFYIFATLNWLWAAVLYKGRTRTTGQLQVFQESAFPLAALSAVSTCFVMFLVVAHLLHWLLESGLIWYEALASFHTYASREGIYVWGKPLYACTLIFSSLAGLLGLVLKSCNWGKEYSPDFHKTTRITYQPLGSPLLGSHPDRVYKEDNRR